TGHIKSKYRVSLRRQLFKKPLNLMLPSHRTKAFRIIKLVQIYYHRQVLPYRVTLLIGRIIHITIQIIAESKVRIDGHDLHLWRGCGSRNKAAETVSVSPTLLFHSHWSG